MFMHTICTFALYLFVDSMLVLGIGGLVAGLLLWGDNLKRSPKIPRATLLLALVACRPGIAQHASQITGPDVNLLDWGVIGGGADDRPAIQAALVAATGGTLHVPPGRWVAGRAGLTYYALEMPDGTRILGDSRERSVLSLAPGTAAGVRLILVDKPGATIENLTLDGGHGSSAQMHDVFVDAPRFTAVNVTLTNAGGDGVYLRSGSGHRLAGVAATGNWRNGITLAATSVTSDVLIEDSTASGNAAQQIDSEPVNPTHVDRVTIRRTTIDAAGASQEWPLTICGSAGGKSVGWLVEDVTILGGGGVYSVWAGDVHLSRVHVTSAGTKPALQVYRDAQVQVDHSDLTATAAGSVVSVLGTGGTQAPSLTMSDTSVASNATSGTGVSGSGFAELALHRVAIANPRAVGFAAVAARATDATSPQPAASTALLDAVTATGWQRGVTVAGNGAARLGALVVLGGNLGGPAWLDDGIGELDLAVLTGATQPDIARSPVNSNMLKVGTSTIVWSPR